MKYYKYHGLGNDYIVLDPAEIEFELTESAIRNICHRNFGIGSDGILLGPIETNESDFALRIFNPDGSEAEKSGNGLRIFSRYLYDKGLVGKKEFSIFTMGGIVKSQVHDKQTSIEIDMGPVSFESDKIPVTGKNREVINEPLTIQGKKLIFCGATVGNPHCVILQDKISAEETKKFGPDIETHSLFPNKINVQFMKIIDKNNIQIEIWERGAGYTLASGSSSSAAAAVAFKLGLCDKEIGVHMPGGKIKIKMTEDYFISMEGPVGKIAEGVMSSEIFLK